jgi:alkylhydroperoxidase family enzyme
LGVVFLTSLWRWLAAPPPQAPLFGRGACALAYAEEATRNKRVVDGTLDELREYFSDREGAEIKVLTAIPNFGNLLNISLGIDSDGLCAMAQAQKL